MMNFEICSDSVECAMAAEKYGAKRIELCAALSVGGLTPNFGLVQACVQQSNVEVHAMVRHKEGGFCYSDEDIEIMKLDIKAHKMAGAHGVVFGVLTESFEIASANKELLDLAKSLGLEVTFHRAFDFVKDYKKAIKTIVDYGFDRLLTSGLESKAIDGIAVIDFLQSNYGAKIQIMPGSGVSAVNAKRIAETGVENLHFTARKTAGNPTELGMGEVMEVDENKINSIIRQFDE